MQSSAWFPFERQSVPKARWWVVGQLEAAGHEARTRDAALCVSELAANAIAHAESPFQVELSDVNGLIRLAVTDESDRAIGADVGIAAVDIGQFSGRGIGVVAALASEWGIIPLPGGGKTVWCQLT